MSEPVTGVVMMVGAVGCGKTTLCQRLNHEMLRNQKTQAVQVVGSSIDTPGEYLENRTLRNALVVTSVDADAVFFLQDATSDACKFSPGQSSLFTNPVFGVVTKVDLSTPEQVADAKTMLRLAGAREIFTVSSVDGNGIEELTEFLKALKEKNE